MLEQCNGLVKVKPQVPCTKNETFPGSGACKFHGGLAPNTVFKSIRRATLSNVTKINEVVEGQVIFPDNPFDTLNQTLIETRQFKELVERKINEMGTDQESWRYQDKAGSEQLRSEIALYERALDRMIRAATALSKLNLEERFVKLSEQQAASMIYIINETFKRTGMTDEQRELARNFVTEIIKEMLTQTGKKRYI